MSVCVQYGQCVYSMSMCVQYVNVCTVCQCVWANTANVHSLYTAHFKHPQILFSFGRSPVSVETHTRVLIHHAPLTWHARIHGWNMSRGCPPCVLGWLASSKGRQMVLNVITVQLGPTEDDGLVHLVLINGAHKVLRFEQLHCLRQRLYAQNTHTIISFFFHAAKFLAKIFHVKQF